MKLIVVIGVSRQTVIPCLFIHFPLIYLLDDDDDDGLKWLNKHKIYIHQHTHTLNLVQQPNEWIVQLLVRTHKLKFMNRIWKEKVRQHKTKFMALYSIAVIENINKVQIWCRLSFIWLVHLYFFSHVIYEIIVDHIYTI